MYFSIPSDVPLMCRRPPLQGISPVLLASPVQGAFFFGSKDVIRKTLHNQGASDLTEFFAAVRPRAPPPCSRLVSSAVPPVAAASPAAQRAGWAGTSFV